MHRGIFIRIILIALAIGFLLDWYIFIGIRVLSAGWKSRRLRQLVRWGYLFTSIGVSVVFLGGFGVFGTVKLGGPFQQWMLSLFITFFVAKVFFALILFLGDIGRFLYGVIGGVVKPSRKGRGSFFPARRRFISEMAVLVAAVPFAGSFYAMLWGKYDYRLHRVTIPFDDLPEAFDGFTITQLSDIHAGSFDNTAAVQRGIDLAKAQQSDLFVFTGDLVNNRASEIEPYLDRFGAIKAPYGQFSILGNHDYGAYIKWDNEEEKANNLDRLKEHHKTMGYRLLLDENVVIEKDGQKIVLVGVQNWGRGFIQVGDLDKALEGVEEEAFKICLSHDPTHWEQKIRYHPTRIQLTLSGHTHGAQFGVETDKFRWSAVQYRYLVWAGLARERGRYLYVNRGFGFIAYSGRLGIWPEITVITLQRV